MVDLELADGLAVVTIDRPNARNAISLETMDQLEKALDGAEGAAALVITFGVLLVNILTRLLFRGRTNDAR